MDIDVLAEAICSGIATATAMVAGSGAPTYGRYKDEETIQAYDFRQPYEPVSSSLVPCPHEDGEHRSIEVGLQDRLPEYYATANIYVATHDVSSYDMAGLSMDTVYTLDLYLWRDQEAVASVERKMIVVAAQCMRALKAAELEWELHPQQVDWSLGEAVGARSDSYRIARFSIAATQYVGD